MGTLYDRISSLCEKRGITGYRMSADFGISKSLIADLKMVRKKTVNAETANKIASYFGVSIGYLLGTDEQTENSPAKNDERITTNENLMFSLWGDRTGIDEDDLEDVRRFAAFV